MNLNDLKKKLKIKITVIDKIDFLLDEVYSGVYGTKSRSRLILMLEDIKNSIKKK